MPTTTAPDETVFDLPAHLHAKADPALVVDDERHLSAIGAGLRTAIDEVEQRLATRRRDPVGTMQERLQRDQEVHTMTARLRTLRRHGIDLCLGHVVTETGETVHVGRLGLVDASGRRLLVDWRSPAAEPFFAATHGDPHGLRRRRRYRWQDGHVVDYWDEVFRAEDLTGRAALDDRSAFVASLGAARTSRMRDVLATIQADQDAIIRAGSHGALVVDGGPGTGKTVVALHRAAYLLYSDPRLDHRRGGVLVVGPHRPYLAYVSDVLPSLGEEGVRTCTLLDLVPEAASAVAEPDEEVARLKASAGLVRAVEAAVAIFEEPPTTPFEVETAHGAAVLRTEDWAEAFAAPGSAPHNEGREVVWHALAEIVADRVGSDDPDDEVDVDAVRADLLRDDALRSTVERAWPMLEPGDVLEDLWSSRALLRACAPWLDDDGLRSLLRPEHPRAWTFADLPLLDAARHRLGDPDAARRAHRRARAASADRVRMDSVVDDLLAADPDGESAVTMLRGADLRHAYLRQPGEPEEERDPLAGPFAHVVVDEAQELTDAEWQMVLRRCPSGSLTIVGDRAQARDGFDGTWPERLARAGVERVEVATLSVNYRTPEEVMTAAEPVIRAAVPDANVPTSVRSTGLPVEHRGLDELDAVLSDWLAREVDGVACVIGHPDLADTPRVRSLAAPLVKGLEFDLVVLVGPERFGDGRQGAVDRYVAMTRATHRLVLLTSR